MLTASALVTLILGPGGKWWTDWRNYTAYGDPRTFQIDAIVGQNDGPSHESHFIGLNLHGPTSTPKGRGTGKRNAPYQWNERQQRALAILWDEDRIDSNIFIKICKEADCLVLTDRAIYDLRIPPAC